jgi:uncharacterized protein
MTTVADDTPAIVPFLKRDGGTPFLSGSRCRACGHLFVGDRQTCAKCAARDQMDSVKLAETGKVYVYTVVHRSFPGVETPFVDAIVDLDDGAHLKGTLLGVSPDPEKIPFGLPVRVIFREAVPVNKPGKPYLTYAFEPL